MNLTAVSTSAMHPSATLRHWTQIASAVRVYTKDSGDDAKRRRVGAQGDVKSAYATYTVEDITGKWWADAEHHIADWMMDSMRKNWAAHGLSADEKEWPKPQQLQTTWADLRL